MKISVCMASYNGAKYIKEQIDSILPQLRESDELIISDDGSTDGTIEIINGYANNKIKLIHNKKSISETAHIAITKNFENALKNANGDFIFLSDQDDIWMPNKIKRMLPYFKNYDCVISDSYHLINGVIDYNSSNMKGISPIMSILKKIKGLRYQGCCIAFQKHILLKTLPFPKNLPLHDGWIGLIAEYTGNVYFLDERLIAYRLHENNISKGKNLNSFSYKIKYRIFLFYNVFKRILFKKQIDVEKCNNEF